MFCTQKPSAVSHPELGSALSLPCREAKSPCRRLKCLPTLVSSAQHQTGFALHINDMGQWGQQHCPLLPTSPTPQKPAVPWGHCPALGCRQVPCAQAAGRSHLASESPCCCSQRALQLWMAITCLAPALAGKPVLQEVPKHTLKPD